MKIYNIKHKKKLNKLHFLFLNKTNKWDAFKKNNFS